MFEFCIGRHIIAGLQILFFHSKFNPDLESLQYSGCAEVFEQRTVLRT